MNKIPDLLGWNIYPGWYSGWGPKESFGALLDRGRSMSRYGGFCVSEYGAGANVEQHEENPEQPKSRRAMASRRVPGTSSRSGVGRDENEAVCLGNVRVEYV